MRRTVIALTLTGALAALATPALAADTPSAEQQCRTERSEMGVQTFRQTYGTNKNRKNAFGKCVSKRSTATEEAAEDAKTNASQECKAEHAADPAAFAEKYGTGKKKNAHGKCVSQTRHEMTAKAVDEQVDADVNAAKTCRAERKADPDAFKEKYGTNKNKRNAFGKCVSKTAKEEATA